MKAPTNPILDEIALVCGAIAAIGEVVTGYATGHVSVTLITAAITAVMAVFTRQNVKPMSKVRRHHEKTR